MNTLPVVLQTLNIPPIYGADILAVQEETKFLYYEMWSYLELLSPTEFNFKQQIDWDHNLHPITISVCELINSTPLASLVGIVNI